VIAVNISATGRTGLIRRIGLSRAVRSRPWRGASREVTVCTGFAWTGTRWEPQCFTIAVFENYRKPPWPDDCRVCGASFDFLRLDELHAG